MSDNFREIVEFNRLDDVTIHTKVIAFDSVLILGG